MPRIIEISAPQEKTDTLIERVRDLDGVVGLSLQRHGSLAPPGDVVVIRATNEGTRAVLDILNDLNLQDGGSITTSEPRSLIARQYQNGLDRESNETVWDEMAFLVRRDTNISANYLTVMALAGGVAAVGLWNDTLHIVVGAMVIAPAFEPMIRIPFGWIAGPRVMASRGLISTLAGYLMLALAAALTYWISRAVDPTAPAELAARSWIRYWSSVSATGVIVAFWAGAAGAVVICSQRPVLSTGVMIALALIPAMAIAGMALAAGEFALAGQGLLRWAVDTVCVLVASSIVLGLKHTLVHRRQALS